MPATPFPADILAASVLGYSGFTLIGSGSYKTAYEVFGQGGVREVLKIIKLPLGGDTPEETMYREQELRRAEREVTLLRDCNSEFVVKLGSMAPRIEDIGGTDCVVYTEEFLPGQELGDLISASNTKPTEAEIRCLLRCLVGAIKSLWTEQNTVHRDIKPGNTFATGLAERPFVLLDLGIAYNVTEPGLTFRPEHAPCTPRYMAPEMLDPNFRENLSYRADLYSAGVTVFEFATGGLHPLARSEGDAVKTISRVLRQEPRRLSDERPDLSPKTARLVDQLLKKNPALRPGNLALLLRQLSP